MGIQNNLKYSYFSTSLFHTKYCIFDQVSLRTIFYIILGTCVALLLLLLRRESNLHYTQYTHMVYNVHH